MSRVEPPVVEFVDLERYLGTWYEIARKPIRHEDRGARDITASYSLDEDGGIKVVNRMVDEDGQVQEAVGSASVVEDSGNAKLEVSFLPAGLRWIPFSKGDYWVLRLDEGYNMALVGTPDYKYLWLLSRNAQPDSRQIVEWLEFAGALGYELGDVIRPAQSGTVAGA